MSSAAASFDTGLPHSGTSKKVHVRPGVELRVILRTGGAPPFLLIHGLASNARLWDDVAGGLASGGHDSIAIDQRGHGESTKPDTGYDFASLTDDLAAVIGATVGGPVIAVGQSWGGNVALELAARHGPLVDGLGLIDGGFIRLADSFSSWPEARAALTPPPLRGLARAEVEEGIRRSLATFPENGIRAQLANFAVLEDDTIEPRLSLAHHLEILEHLWDHDPDAVASTLDVPISVVATRHGMPGKVERVEAFVSAVRDGALFWVDAHHDVHAEKPEVVTEILEGLGRRVENRR